MFPGVNNVSLILPCDRSKNHRVGNSQHCSRVLFQKFALTLYRINSLGFFTVEEEMVDIWNCAFIALSLQRLPHKSGSFHISHSIFFLNIHLNFFLYFFRCKMQASASTKKLMYFSFLSVFQLPTFTSAQLITHL